MSTYHINDVERLTGIKAHTLRIWEKRYAIAIPHRTDTNIRFYDDEQLRKLLNVATLLKQGEKISAVAALNDKEINERIAAAESRNHMPTDAIIETYINNLVTAMMDFDEAAFEKIFSSAINRLGVYQAMLGVFYPFMIKTGTLWSTNEIMPAQEHFAINIIKRKLMAAIDGLPPAILTDKRYILYLPEEEWHEISLLLADYILKHRGYATLYLGQSVPHQNLLITIEKYRPTHILGFYIAEKDVNKIKRQIGDLSKKFPKLGILVSGASLAGSKLSFPKNVKCLHTPQELTGLPA